MAVNLLTKSPKISQLTETEFFNLICLRLMLNIYAVNVLTNNAKISYLIKRDVFQLNLCWINGKLRKNFFVQISAVFGTREHVDS